MELLEQFARGDLEAFEALFRQFQREVYGWIIRMVRDRWVAEDLTVETFWRIYKAHARFDPNRSFGPWARRIATNVALDYLKRHRPEVELVENISQGELPDPALSRDMRERIARAFSRLPAKLRVAATLALIEERPYQEIAESLGISVGGVKSRVFRSVRRLRKELKAQGVQP
ncbi:MAG: RNA polymerase sigma factor [Acidobacteria bacterium]|nr:RNA polymerase sigma factor [Acidobacteriota bacterium]